MVDETGKVAYAALIDLVAIVRGPANHDVQPFNAAGNQADKFGNGSASIKVLELLVGAKPGRNGLELRPQVGKDVHSERSRRCSCHSRY